MTPPSTNQASFTRVFWWQGMGLLTLLYGVAFAVAYTPIGATLGIAMPGAFLYLKLAGVIALCLAASFWVCLRVVEAGCRCGARPWRITTALLTIFTLTLLLLVVTPMLAILLGISYRGLG